MKIKYSVLMQAMKQFGYGFSTYLGENSDHSVMEVELIEEDPGSGSMVACLRFSSSEERLDKYTEKQVTTTRIIELYDDASKQGAKLIKQEAFSVNDPT